jgi:hypothetical protein
MQTKCNIELKESQYLEVSKYSLLAKKERSIVSNTGNTKWFQIIENGEEIGCCGIYLAKNKIRLKGDYVLPQCRGRGIYTIVNNFREEYGRQINGVNKVEVLTLHPNHFKKRGYNMLKETRKGIWLGELNL